MTGDSNESGSNADLVIAGWNLDALDDWTNVADTTAKASRYEYDVTNRLYCNPFLDICGRFGAMGGSTTAVRTVTNGRPFYHNALTLVEQWTVGEEPEGGFLPWVTGAGVGDTAPMSDTDASTRPYPKLRVVK